MLTLVADRLADRLAGIKRTREGYYLLVPQRIRRYAGQPRKHFDPDAMQDLRDSISDIGQRKPIEVKPIYDDPRHDWELVDGERRWRCALEIPLKHLKAIINEPEDEEEQFWESLAGNIPPHLHTPLEISEALKRVRDSAKMKNKPMTEVMRRVASLFGKSVGWAQNYAKILRLAPQVQALMDDSRVKEERLNVSVAGFISTFADGDFQWKLAVAAVEKGWTRQRVELYAEMLQRTASKKELRLGLREKKPSDHFRSLTSFLARLHEGSEWVLSMPGNVFKEMFLKRKKEDRDVVLAEVKSCIKNLKELEQVLSRTD